MIVRNTGLPPSSSSLESSLPLAGNGTRIDKPMLFQYLASEQLKLPEPFVRKTTDAMLHHAIAWKLALDRSYLSARQKFDYQQLLTERVNRIR